MHECGCGGAGSRFPARLLQASLAALLLALLVPASAAALGQEAYLKASNTGAGDEFGSSVAIASETLVAGADGEDSNATGVGGDQANNGAASSGVAYATQVNSAGGGGGGGGGGPTPGPPDPGPDPDPSPSDNSVDGARLDAKNIRLRTGKQIKIRLQVAAGEDVKALGNGRIAIGAGKGSVQLAAKPLKLTKATKRLQADQPKNLTLKLRRKKANVKVFKALERGKSVTAKTSVRFSDDAGNRLVLRRVVRLVVKR